VRNRHRKKQTNAKRYVNTANGIRIHILVFEYSATVILTLDLAEMWVFISTIITVMVCITQPNLGDAVRFPNEKATKVARRTYNAQQ